MKKKILLGIALIMLLLCFTSCRRSMFVENLPEPILSKTGCIVEWGKIDHAKGYEVYVNGAIAKTTYEPFYISNKLEDDASIEVIALGDGENYDDSYKSEPIIIERNSGYTGAELMDISLSNDKSYSVPANVKYLRVSGSANESYIKILNRTTDLVIELNSVTLTSPGGKNCIGTEDGSYDFSKSSFTTTFVINGSNTLTGADSTKIPEQPKSNSSKNGTNGEDGASGIVLPSIVLTGNGSISLCGGNGGKGGKGANSEGLFGAAIFGKGGKGGAGGSGIKCTQVVLAMDNSSELNADGAIGGEGGTPGDNGSVLTGPTMSLIGQWDRSFGAKGDDGKDIIGNIKIYSGMYSDK